MNVLALRRILREIPGIAWVIIGVALWLLVIAVSGRSTSRIEHLEARVKQADSTAVVQTFAAVIWHRDAVAAHAVADSVRRWADSAVATAVVHRTDVAARIVRAASSRAQFDTSGLPAVVLSALADADTLRLAVTPALVADSIAIATVSARAAHLEVAYALLETAYQAQGIALTARTDQAQTLEQLHAPRCRWKCGAAIGASAVVAAQLSARALILLVTGR
jgi:hypothetical protein